MKRIQEWGMHGKPIIELVPENEEDVKEIERLADLGLVDILDGFSSRDKEMRAEEARQHATEHKEES